MHPNPAFRTSADPRDIDFIRARGFGTLTMNGPTAPLTSHIPFLLDEAGKQIELHLVRSNPMVRAITEPAQVVITCLGPDGYVSPDWYEVDDQVPTWNYVAARIEGTIHRLPDDDLRGILDRLSHHFEEPLQKTNWTSDKMSDGVMDRMMRMIVPFRIDVASIDGTWKLNQNKPDAARHAAAEKIATGHGADLDHLSKLMIDPTRHSS